MRELVDFLESLFDILEIEIEDYEQLFELEMTSRHLLTIHSIEALWMNLQEREHLLQHIATCEIQRQQIVQALAASLHLGNSDITISKLSACVSEPYTSRLRQTRTKLHYIVTKTKQCSEENSAYLQSALLLINKGLDHCKFMAETHITYRSYGSSPITKRGLLFSERV